MMPRMSETEEREAPSTQASPSESLGAAGRDLRDLLDYFSRFISAKVDSLWSTGRTLGFFAALAVVALVMVLGIVGAAGVMIVVGIAEGLTKLFGRAWLGDLASGLLVLGVILGGGYVGIKIVLGRSLRRIRQKY